MKLWRLFHKIGPGGEDSATVRAHIVEHGLTDQIEFSNIAYETARGDLQAATGGEETPTLIADGEIYSGAKAILAFLRARTR